MHVCIGHAPCTSNLKMLPLLLCLLKAVMHIFFCQLLIVTTLLAFNECCFLELKFVGHCCSELCMHSIYLRMLKCTQTVLCNKN